MMALGLGFACCCGGCYELQNCDTLETITTTSDLSAYEKDQVLRRDETEGGGCWKLIALDAACDNAETFTVAAGPFMGASACAVCLAGNMPPDGCQSCGESVSLEGQPMPAKVRFAIEFLPTIEQDVDAIYRGGGVWTVDVQIHACGVVADFTFQLECIMGTWMISAESSRTGFLGTLVANSDPAGPGQVKLYNGFGSTPASLLGDFDDEECAEAGTAGIEVEFYATTCGGGDGE